MFNNFIDALNKMLNTQANDQITTLPHPEEPMNPSATLANTDVMAIITKWLSDWGVPAQYWDYWKTAIDMQVYEIYPAFSYSNGNKSGYTFSHLGSRRETSPGN